MCLGITMKHCKCYVCGTSDNPADLCVDCDEVMTGNFDDMVVYPEEIEYETTAKAASSHQVRDEGEV